MLDMRSKARQKLLAYYFTNPTTRHHLRDLAERLSVDPSNLSKELSRLEREGLFRSEVSGRQKYFQLNREYPLFKRGAQHHREDRRCGSPARRIPQEDRRNRRGLFVWLVRAKPAGRG
jgi:DNA-binding transcriptional ArsR family regulator